MSLLVERFAVGGKVRQQVASISRGDTFVDGDRASWKPSPYCVVRRLAGLEVPQCVVELVEALNHTGSFSCRQNLQLAGLPALPRVTPLLKSDQRHRPLRWHR